MLGLTISRGNRLCVALLGLGLRALPFKTIRLLLVNVSQLDFAFTSAIRLVANIWVWEGIVRRTKRLNQQELSYLKLV